MRFRFENEYISIRLGLPFSSKMSRFENALESGSKRKRKHIVLTRSSHREGKCCRQLRTANRAKTVCRTVEHMNCFFIKVNNLDLLAL